jgi:hypothetical protein
MAEARQKGVGQVVIARHGHDRGAERTKKRGRLLELRPAPAVGQIAAGHDQLRLRPLDQLFEARTSELAAPRAEVKVRQV